MDYKDHNVLDVEESEIFFAEDYLLKKTIGSGTFGQIYSALHQKTKQMVAIKLESRLTRNH